MRLLQIPFIRIALLFGSGIEIGRLVGISGENHSLKKYFN